MSTVKDSPVKLVPESAEVEMDLFSSSDSLTPVSTRDIQLCLWALSQSFDLEGSNPKKLQPTKQFFT